jgi:spermidine synthase
MIGTKILEEVESKYNGHVRVVKTFGLGTYIQADGLTQSGGIVEGFWDQTLKKVHSSLPLVGSSLILGLGGGTAAKLIRKIWPGSKINGIDLDPLMVELGKKYLDLNETEVEVKIQDAYIFKGRYDLILIDLYNGDKFPEKFGEVEFLRRIRSGLTKNGYAIFNRTFYGDNRTKALKFGKKLEKVFAKVEYYYPEVNLMVICHN